MIREWLRTLKATMSTVQKFIIFRSMPCLPPLVMATLTHRTAKRAFWKKKVTAVPKALFGKDRRNQDADRRFFPFSRMYMQHGI